MKVKICAGVILACTLVFVLLNCIISVGAVERIEKGLDKIDIYSVDAHSDALLLYSEYAEGCAFLSLTVNQRELSEIEDCFTELCGYLRTDMRSEAAVAKDRLKSALGRLRQSLGIGI